MDEFDGLRQGNVYTLQNGQLWEQTEPYTEIHLEIRPDAIIWNNGGAFVMKVAGVEHPVEVRRIPIETESEIVDEFDGLRQGNVYELQNGQFWEQTEQYSEIDLETRPDARIWNNGGAFVMKVAGVEHAVEVRQIEDVKGIAIVSDFHGFSQGAVFILETGERWEQKDPFIGVEVRVAPKAFIWKEGAEFRLKVSGGTATVAVSEIK